MRGKLRAGEESLKHRNRAGVLALGQPGQQSGPKLGGVVAGGSSVWSFVGAVDVVFRPDVPVDERDQPHE